ncbi:hypothetical protein Hanom_Chr05g00460191 [Helianthus anomalus]
MPGLFLGQTWTNLFLPLLSSSPLLLLSVLKQQNPRRPLPLLHPISFTTSSPSHRPSATHPLLFLHLLRCRPTPYISICIQFPAVFSAIDLHLR